MLESLFLTIYAIDGSYNDCSYKYDKIALSEVVSECEYAYGKGPTVGKRGCPPYLRSRVHVSRCVACDYVVKVLSRKFIGYRFGGWVLGGRSRLILIYRFFYMNYVTQT